jgi:eukaryotic-like serine/threonine-protein kinase
VAITITPEVWKRVEEVFSGAMEVSEEERRAFVDRMCGDDPEIRDEVLSLIANANGAEGSLHGAVASEMDAVATALASIKVGHRVGPYRLVSLIAEGGMGEVFLVERDDANFQRRVAIKLLRWGYGNADAINRLRDERRILAGLDHPNIVRLIDGGTTEDGLPYLVMDYVEGVTLTHYARDHRLSVRERLGIFIEVCAAVQYAHQKLVVHRDLKPSNILVGKDGKAHLLDFGIAKLLDPVADRSREAKTATGIAPLTLEYASPEQARGEPVTVATDVYSLGCVLYELLADCPAMPPTKDPLQLLRAISDFEPPRPSTKCPPERRSAVAGDLDNIVAKAQRKDPSQRYASVAQLSDDLERHLSGRPVLAHAPTLGYRAGKFLRRHWGKTALAALAVAGLASSTAVSFVQARRANEAATRAKLRFDEVRALARSLLFELDPKLRDLSGATTARALVVERALQYLDRLASESQDVQLEREVALAYMRVGDIQGNLYEPNLGKPDDALASYKQARAIIERLPDDIERKKAAAAASFGMAFLHEILGRYDDVSRELTDAFAIVGALPADQIDYPLVARGYELRVHRDMETADLTQAPRDAAAEMSFVHRWRERDSGSTAQYWSGVTASSIGRVDTWMADPDAAIVSFRGALAEFEHLATAFPDDLRYARERGLNLFELAGTYSGFGDNWDWTANTGEVGEGEHAARMAVDVVHQISTRDPGDMRALEDEATMTSTLAAAVAERSPKEGLALFERALATWDSLPKVDRATHYAIVLEFFTHCGMAVPLARLGRGSDAREQARQGLALLSSEPADAVLEERANCTYQLARAEHALSDDAAAATLVDKAIAALEPDVASHSMKISRYIGLVRGLQLRALLRPRDACSARARSVAAWRGWRGPETRFTRRVLAELESAAKGCKP